ncbi:hypothetical protein BASA81_007318 [Batrachochytrium salamandrivorans]|nr:hypothetical protein BASA81_007318 [Batrachochytrium salamandrivorans]
MRKALPKPQFEAQIKDALELDFSHLLVVLNELCVQVKLVETVGLVELHCLAEILCNHSSSVSWCEFIVSIWHSNRTGKCLCSLTRTLGCPKVLGYVSAKLEKKLVQFKPFQAPRLPLCMVISPLPRTSYRGL